MRFVCESCQTRYVVPDDRLQGRTLKVRCKKCGNLILLKGQPETPVARPVAEVATSHGDQREQWQGTAATSASAPLDEGRDEERPEWHVILPGGQIGPVPLSALIQKMVSGEMPARAYVWRDGMSDWKRAEQVPEVARWLPALRPSSPAPSPASRTPAPAHSHENSGSSTGVASASTVRSDPLARVASSPEFASSKPGELTKFYITQALTKPRSPWALLAFGVGAVVLLAGGFLGLAELGVPMPLVSAESGARPKIFSGAQGDSHVRDLLYGHPKSQAAPGGPAAQRSAAQGQAEQGAGQGQGPGQGPLAKRAEQHVDQLGKSDKDQLSRLYASQDLSTLKLKPTEGALPVLDRPDAPLTPEQVSRTVAKFQSGYTRCIDAELKRNPNFQGGRIRIVTTIMSSGLVRQAQIVSDDQRLQRSVTGGQLGSCLSEQTRRMVFPNFQGDPFDAEIPLVLSSAAL